MASAAHLARLADQARTQLEYLRGILPPQLQSLLPKPAAPSRFAYLTSHLPKALTRYISPELLLAVLLPLLIAVALMSSWRGFIGDRYSPFTTATPHRPPPTVTDDDFQYLGPDDVVDPPSSHHDHHRQNYRYGAAGDRANASDSHHDRQNYHDYGSAAASDRTPAGVLRAHADNPDMPDVLILKHRGTTYPLHFRAFAIGEGLLCVGEVRRQAASATGTTDPRRIKLLYKGTPLRDDARPCRDEGLKQNSEITCVVSGRPSTGAPDSAAASSDESADEADMVAARLDNGEARVDADGNLIGGRSRRRRSDRPSQSQAGRPRRRSNSLTDDGYLFPTDPRDISTRRQRDGAAAASSAPRPTVVPPSLKPTTSAGPPSPKPSAAPPSPKPAHSTANAGPSPPFPKTPTGKLDEIAYTLRTTFVPRVDAFVRAPPRDQRTRDQEYMKLSEGVLAQIIFKLDEVEGDESVKLKRRALVKETQGVLAGLDAVGKRK